MAASIPGKLPRFHTNSANFYPDKPLFTRILLYSWDFGPEFVPFVISGKSFAIVRISIFSLINLLDNETIFLGGFYIKQTEARAGKKNPENVRGEMDRGGKVRQDNPQCGYQELDRDKVLDQQRIQQNYKMDRRFGVF
jgi:hypothetical protein